MHMILSIPIIQRKILLLIVLTHFTLDCYEIVAVRNKLFVLKKTLSHFAKSIIYDPVMQHEFILLKSAWGDSYFYGQ